VIIWTVNTGTLLHTFRGHSGPVKVISLTGDDQWLISSSHDYTVRIWSVQTGTCKVMIPIHRFWRISRPIICNHDQQIIVMTPTYKIQKWTVRTGNVERLVNLKRKGGILRVVLNAKRNGTIPCVKENQFLFNDCYDYSVEVWNFTTETRVQIFRGHQHPLTDGIFVQENTKVVSCDRIHTLCIWRVHDGICIHQFSNYQLSKSIWEHTRSYWLEKANIECIIVYTDFKAHILAINSGQILYTMPQCHNLQVSWDGRFFVSNSDWFNGVFKCVEFTDLKKNTQNQNSNDF